MKLLVVDDEKMIRQLIAKYAVFDGYEVAEAENGMQAVEMARAGGYDLIIMDIMMPELDGFSAAREIRKTSDVPIIFLSARGEEYDRIHGFELGVDDYVVKPFGVMELLSRIRAVLRRARPAPAQDTALCVCGRITLDPARRAVTVAEDEVRLTYKEFELLYYLMQNQGLVMSRDKLMEAVWGFDFEGESRTVDMHIKSLLRKLADCGSYVQTIRGVGYKIDDTVGG